MRQLSQNPHRRALVVDDDELVRNFIREVLAARGFEVYVAGDGETAASIYESRPDLSLIVTDILMPAADGISFILKIRRLGQGGGAHRPKIIAISGGGTVHAELYLESAKGLGADLTLQKPFSLTDLTEALARLDFSA